MQGLLRQVCWHHLTTTSVSCVDFSSSAYWNPSLTVRYLLEQLYIFLAHDFDRERRYTDEDKRRCIACTRAFCCPDCGHRGAAQPFPPAPEPVLPAEPDTLAGSPQTAVPTPAAPSPPVATAAPAPVIASQTPETPVAAAPATVAPVAPLLAPLSVDAELRRMLDMLGVDDAQLRANTDLLQIIPSYLVGSAGMVAVWCAGTD